jgi:translation initiation factor IF-3
MQNPRYYQTNYRTNWQIRSPTVRVIDEEGKQIGVIDINTARNMAREKGLDLVEIAPKARPPVAKIADYAKLKYQEAKKKKEERKKQKIQDDIKEIQLSPFIGDADFNTRIERAQEFAKKGFKLRIVIKFKGRQITKKEFGFEMIDRLKEELLEIYEPETEAKLIGKRIIIIFKPVKNDKK